jgi:hypothetical protein
MKPDASAASRLTGLEGSAHSDCGRKTTARLHGGISAHNTFIFMRLMA